MVTAIATAHRINAAAGTFADVAGDDGNGERERPRYVRAQRCEHGMLMGEGLCVLPDCPGHRRTKRKQASDPDADRDAEQG
jgi:hypothetical protein